MAHITSALICLPLYLRQFQKDRIPVYFIFVPFTVPGTQWVLDERLWKVERKRDFPVAHIHLGVEIFTFFFFFFFTTDECLKKGERKSKPQVTTVGHTCTHRRQHKKKPLTATEQSPGGPRQGSGRTAKSPPCVAPGRK